MPNRLPTAGIPTPAVRKSSTAQNAATYRQQVSPAGVAKAAAANKEAMVKKYPSAYPMKKTTLAKGPTKGKM